MKKPKQQVNLQEVKVLKSLRNVEEINITPEEREKILNKLRKVL